MHRWSRLFIPTLREAPSDAEVASHKLLLRAGYVRQLGAGIYSHLFLGRRSINKIVAIVRAEMDRIGQEFLLPELLPADLWQQSGRWTTMGENMFRLKDRKGADLCMAMTHEEIMCDIARKELRSYKQLPQIWYQIQTKFRDEPRPKSGLLRVRQFLMKDSYSFDIDAEGLDRSYDLHDEVYRAIFARCGLEVVAVEADSGAMGGSQSQEFMVYTDAGEDLIASCPVCGYAANLEKATSRLLQVADLTPTGDGRPELVHTPGKAAIADVAAFFGILPAQDIKCVAYMAEVRGADGKQTWQPVAAFLRGDHTVNEVKLLGAAGGALALRTMNGEELERWLGGPAGYLGPIGLDAATAPYDGKLTVVVDQALSARQNLVAGANALDYHYRNVTPGRDFSWTVMADIRNAVEGELCPVCPEARGNTLRIGKAVEIGHIFKLGSRYAEALGATVLAPNGREITLIMGSYGIGIERILTAAIEQAVRRQPNGAGFVMPPRIAPFEVVVTVTNIGDELLRETGEQVAAQLETAGFDVLLDDRDERAGVKFKDADLVGIPYRVTVGKKAADGKVELVQRSAGITIEVAIGEVAALLRQGVGGEGAGATS
jgi:prolyl-tRNA synthetase